MKLAGRVVVAVVVIVAAGCGGSPKPAPPPIQAEAPPPEEVVPSDIPVVTLLEPGAQPRRALRYQPAEGVATENRMVMSMSMSIQLDPANKPLTIDIPPFRMVANTRVSDVGRAGFSATTTITGADLAPGADRTMAATLEPELAKMIGTVMAMRLSPRGVVESTEMRLPADASAQFAQTMQSMKDSMRQATSPFPEEPVGVGARWRVVSKLDSTMTLTQTAVFELVSLDRDRGTLRVTIDQAAPAQQLTSPGMPPNSRLESMSSTGSGTVEFDLARVMPANLELGVQTSLVIVADGGSEGTTRSAMSMALGTTMTSTPLAH